MSEQESDISQIARDVLEMLLSNLGVAASVELGTLSFVEETEGAAPVALSVSGEDLGILIGRRGQTLACLQYVVRLIVANREQMWVLIIIDVEGYKARRYESLRALAERMAEQVKVRQRPFTLEPMPAYERRIIHLALADHPDITTESTGIDELRKVVILPRQ